MDKVKIISAIIEEQQKVINGLKSSAERYKSEADLDEDQTQDPEDYSRQNEAKDMQLRYEKLLLTAQKNWNILEKAKSENYTEIEIGTLIETDKNYIFVGISLPVFKYEGKDVISVSEEAPVFQTLKSKTLGDTLELGNNNFKIISFN
jgi:hypothetical protein